MVNTICFIESLVQLIFEVSSILFELFGTKFQVSILELLDTPNCTIIGCDLLDQEFIISEFERRLCSDDLTLV